MIIRYCGNQIVQLVPFPNKRKNINKKVSYGNRICMPSCPIPPKKKPVGRPSHQSWAASTLSRWSVRAKSISGPDALISQCRLAGWGAWRWSVLLVATVRRLRALELDAVLLTVVVLVRTVAVVPIVVICRSGVWRCGSAIVVVVVGLRVVVARSGSPASAVEWCATGLAPTTSSDAAAEEEEKQESNHDNCENHPSHPGIPGRLSVASSLTIAVDRASVVGHDVRDLC